MRTRITTPFGHVAGPRKPGLGIDGDERGSRRLEGDEQRVSLRLELDAAVRVPR